MEAYSSFQVEKKKGSRLFVCLFVCYFNKYITHVYNTLTVTGKLFQSRVTVPLPDAVQTYLVIFLIGH